MKIEVPTGYEDESKRLNYQSQLTIMKHKAKQSDYFLPALILMTETQKL